MLMYFFNAREVTLPVDPDDSSCWKKYNKIGVVDTWKVQARKNHSSMNNWDKLKSLLQLKTSI